MTFDMTKCKIGDKLRTMAGGQAEYTSYDSSNSPYCWWIDNQISVDKDGYRYSASSPATHDIIGFWEEEPTEEDEQSFPNIEKRIPYVVKTVTYRIHFNELYSRDITSDEAEAIYEQLKTLLGK